jgi:tRNA U34 5-methylaminomethyl-2-thiouridine-forming methyltransferase MnmC
MNDQIEYAEIEWLPGAVPFATHFDDPYFSLENGLAETQHVFLIGNGLPDRFAPGFHIGELGFGTGLNLLCAWKAWEEAGCETPLVFTSFEAFPMNPKDMAKAQNAWPDLADYVQRFAQIWDSKRGVAKSATLEVRVVYGDVREKLGKWGGQADAWFLDGFSPAKNPEMWEEQLMMQVGQHTKPLGSFATYTAAGHVRRALAKGGFDVKRIAGFGRKRHMTHGILTIG